VRHLHALRRLLARVVLTLGGAALLVAVGYAGSQVLAPDLDPDLDPVAGDVAAGGVPAPGAPPTATGAPSQVRPVVAGPTPHGRVVPGVAFEVLLVPGPTLLGPGEEGDDVRDLQARLRQIAWLSGAPDGVYGDTTTAAVSGFQAKREIPVTGAVDQRTTDRLLAMTTEPTEAELTGAVDDTASNAPGALDPRCLTGRVMCVDKTTSTLRWVVDGDVLRTMDARFGGSATATREGQFSVFSMSRDHVSSLYDTSMPFAMFFSGGQAVHYSPDFASVGYGGASHGCVNIRDLDGIAALFDEVQVGDAVVVYWS
jgi:peptidoglycan hydrolase-like protein with peptidoglycan-binding domain